MGNWIIKCDHCENNLSEPNGFAEYHLCLNSFSRPIGKVVFEVAIDPPIKRNHYFCGLKCLSKWSQDRRDHTEE